jgi:RHS repeat-associated protein
MSTTAVHSQAFNFLSYLQHGVDPRTGQYTMSLSLPELQCNALAGPALPLVISFNPMNTDDDGFGIGWGVGLTEYRPATRQLALSSGERFTVTGSGPLPGIDEKKLDNFRFYDDGGGQYTVVHRSGVVEVLKTGGSADDVRALPAQVMAADGRRLALEYVPFLGGQRLAGIREGDGRALLEVVRGDRQVELLFFPGAGSNGDALARYVLSLDGEGCVREVVLPTTEKAGWRLAYEQRDGIVCLTDVWTPTGGHEQIQYATDGDKGHTFPGKARPPLPRVTRHVVEPGFGQPVMETRYQFSSSSSHAAGNFLGFGGIDDWPDDGRDHLYDASADYTYGTTEEQWSEGRAQRRTERTFNRFHLLVEEVTTQGNCRKRVTTLHYADHEDNRQKPFADQPPQCQLPMTVATTWTLIDNPSRIRTEVAETRFDDHGNLLQRTAADGRREVNTYYDKHGEGEACPPDPEGFVRSLRDCVQHPAPSSYGQAPTLRTAYTYVALPALAGAHADWFLLQRAEILLDETAGEVQRIETDHFDDPADAVRVGREKSVKQTRNGLSTITDHQYATLDSARLGEAVLEVVETITGFDGTHRAITQRHSLLHGEPLLVEDENGVELQYSYDALARVTRETVAPGTDYQASREYTYHLVDPDSGDQAWQMTTDVKGVQTRTWFDGLSRAVTEERQDVDAADAKGLARAASLFRPTYHALHNGLGELVQEVNVDWLREENMALESRYGYDQWGERNCTTRPDRVVEWDVLDPIGDPDAPGGVRTRWLEATDGAVGGVTETGLDRFDNNVRIERFDSHGAPSSVVLNHHDGLGRLVEQVDARQERTRYRYDVFDRVVETIVPGGHVVVRSYAPHSADDLPTRISVDEVELGTQTFDGLDRMVAAVTGGRRRALFYDGGKERPGRVVTPAGCEIQYEYQPLLGEEIVVRRLPGSTADYTYDRENSRLTACAEQGIQLQREYYSTGAIRRETRQQEGHDQDLAEYAYSLQGRLLGYAALGMSQEHTYDNAGRVEVVRQGTTSTRMEYDTFGRVSRLLGSDSQGGITLTTSIDYDDFNREISRTFNASGSVRTLALAYDAADALATRVVTEGGVTVRGESFSYDARGRLEIHECSGTELPQDAWGKPITRQIFISDALDNLLQVQTWWSDVDRNVAAYAYSTIDPVQLESITNTHADYPRQITLAYDADGNLTRDEHGRTLVYDPLGRLSRVEETAALAGRTYRFDALDLLVGSTSAGVSERRFYLDDALAACGEGTSSAMFLHANGQLLAEQSVGNDPGTILLATDQSNTVLREVRQGAEHDVTYTAYGFPGQAPLWTQLGYNGQLHEPDTQWQLLGSGYRAYNPVLLRFHGPDDLSPFAEGGANTYAYCRNDPVNFVDPSGHFAWWTLSLAVGVGAGIGAAVVKDTALKTVLGAVAIGALVLGGIGGIKAARGARFGKAQQGRVNPYDIRHLSPEAQRRFVANNTDHSIPLAGTPKLAAPGGSVGTSADGVGRSAQRDAVPTALNSNRHGVRPGSPDKPRSDHLANPAKKSVRWAADVGAEQTRTATRSKKTASVRREG